MARKNAAEEAAHDCGNRARQSNGAQNVGYVDEERGLPRSRHRCNVSAAVVGLSGM